MSLFLLYFNLRNLSYLIVGIGNVDIYMKKVSISIYYKLEWILFCATDKGSISIRPYCRNLNTVYFQLSFALYLVSIFFNKSSSTYL